MKGRQVKEGKGRGKVKKMREKSSRWRHLPSSCILLLLAILTSEHSTSPILIQISFCLQFSLSFISPVKDQTNLLIRKHSLSSSLLHMDCLQANYKGIVLPSIWSGFSTNFHSFSLKISQFFSLKCPLACSTLKLKLRIHH